jgi:glyoxylase-like metal-dependent hydrolase (beta-lactamase superfamily II)
MVEDTHRITNEVWLEPTPGHTPGHFSVRISSRGNDAVITGDLMHHPVQFAHPEWNCGFDSIPDQARSTRRAFIERYADKPVMVFGTHFATPTAGHVVKEGINWRFRV